MSLELPQFDSEWILQNRGPKNDVDPNQSYAHLIEQEISPKGIVENVGTIFLTNRECPYRCLMCDLWKNTTDHSVTSENLLKQIDLALEEFSAELAPIARSIQSLKLYNSGNFFDKKAIPTEAFQGILSMANSHRKIFDLKRLIIENHPKLVAQSCLDFANGLDLQLEVAMGLETIHPKILPRLNKQMTLDDFKRATHFLVDNDVLVRAFVLLKTPFMSDDEGVEWALKSVEWAFEQGVNCCAVIPTRTGNGSMEKLVGFNYFSEPKLWALESLMDQGMKLRKQEQRLFIDLWDSARFAECQDCHDARVDRLHQMNLQQQTLPGPDSCVHCHFKSSV